jgi:hypothetical protein
MTRPDRRTRPPRTRRPDWSRRLRFLRRSRPDLTRASRNDEGRGPSPPRRLVGDGSGCDGCGRKTVDLAVILLPEEDLGFCSTACMVGYVRRRWIEVD